MVGTSLTNNQHRLSSQIGKKGMIDRGERERPHRVQRQNQPCLHTLRLRLGIVATNSRAKSEKKKKKNNEMGPAINEEASCNASF